MPIIVANRIHVAKGWEEDFERRWRNRKYLLSGLPGFIRNEVLKPIRSDYYVIMTHWETMEDFERWTKSEEFRKSHENVPPKEAFSGPNVLEIHEILAEYRQGHRDEPVGNGRPQSLPE